MGLMDILGGPGATRALGQTAKGVAEVFVPNATRKMELAGEALAGAMGQYSEEFRQGPQGWFDRFVNGLNRMPRPMLALGTLGLFVYAMAEPAGFAVRMQGLAHVPEPLWWLLGAIVSFYFGAREAHYFRARGNSAPPLAAVSTAAPAEPEANAALAAWQAAGRS